VFSPGQTVRLAHGTEIFTIKAVSAYVEMVKIDGGWVWANHVRLVEDAPEVPDPLDEQLEFLGL